jgi:predicted nucleic acid-binding protein
MGGRVAQRPYHVNTIYDAGVLVAADRGDRASWARHRELLSRGLVPWTTAPVVAQVSRSPRQARLRRFLRTCHVAPFESAQAHAVGALLAGAKTDDVVDAHLALTAFERTAGVLTSDAADLRRLCGAFPKPVRVLEI